MIKEKKKLVKKQGKPHSSHEVSHREKPYKCDVFSNVKSPINYQVGPAVCL